MKKNQYLCLLVIFLVLIGVFLPSVLKAEKNHFFPVPKFQSNNSSNRQSESFRSKIVKTNAVDVKVSSSSYSAYNPSITVDSQKTLWTCYPAHNTSHYFLRVARSTDGGQTWKENVGYIYSSNLIISCDIAADLYNDNVYVVYDAAKDNSSLEYEIYMFRVKQFDLKLVTSVESNFYPSIAIDQIYGQDNRIYVAYERVSSSGLSIVVSVSLDDGDSFIEWHNNNPAYSDGVVVHPDIAVSYEGTVYLTYATGNLTTNLKKIIVEYGTPYTSAAYFSKESLLDNRFVVM